MPDAREHRYILVNPPAEGTVTVVFNWARLHGDCVECNLPAAYDALDAYGPGEHQRLCSVCAAGAASNGSTIVFLNAEEEEAGDGAFLHTITVDESTEPGDAKFKAFCVDACGWSGETWHHADEFESSPIIYAEVDEQGTAIAGTGACLQHLRAGVIVHDVSGNDQIHCHICGAVAANPADQAHDAAAAEGAEHIAEMYPTPMDTEKEN